MPNLSVSYDPPVARLVLDRPARRNAITAAMWTHLPSLCAEIESHSQIKAVIVEGAGDYFCSGAEITEFDRTFSDIESARTYLGVIENALLALSQLDRPTLAKMRGAAIGGGLAVALAGDLRVAADDTYFSIPPAKLGLLYGRIETRLLVETVGPAVAKDLLFSGRAVSAGEALSMGLINRCLPDASLDVEVERQAGEWSNLSGASVRGAKKAVRAVLDLRLGDLRAMVEDAVMGEDFREGRAAFLEKRSPLFARRN
jgi:enoyl-CoA hydratase/carnithine racemase